VSETLVGVNISVFLPSSETGASCQEEVEGAIEVASASVKNCDASKCVGAREIFSLTRAELDGSCPFVAIVPTVTGCGTETGGEAGRREVIGNITC
jgi:hypothetical protein